MNEQELFDISKSIMGDWYNFHFTEGELDENSVVAKFATTARPPKIFHDAGRALKRRFAVDDPYFAVQ